MRKISKEITLTIDGSPQGFRLTKPDAFSGVEILRLVMRLQDQWEKAGRNVGDDHSSSGRTRNESNKLTFHQPSSATGGGFETPLVPTPTAEVERRKPPLVPTPTVLDLITSLSAEELRSVMTSCLNHVSVLLPAGPNPVMTGSEWGYPELKHDTVSCMKLVLEEIAWALEGFFGDGGRNAPPADATMSP